jgi:hypothetical protein
MNRDKFFLCLIVALTSPAPKLARAQETDVAGTLYSRGVEDFFAGRLQDANSFFSRSIAINPNDPRAYYFRSLSRLAQGCQDAARDDMQIGARLEARLPNRFAMGKTFERVQGPARMLLERYRQSARAYASVVARPALTPAAATEPDTAVLREQKLVPLDQLLQPGVPRSFAVPAAVPTNPIPRTALPAAKAPAIPAAAPEADPFSDDSTPKTRPAPSPANPTAPANPAPTKAAAPEKSAAPAAPKPLPPRQLPPAPKSSSNDEDPFK